MRFLVLAALIAASSAAGLRASPDNIDSIEDFDELQAWYDFGGPEKAECIGKAISNSTDAIMDTTDRVLKALKKHSAFKEIVEEIEYVRDTFLAKLKLFEEETREVNVMRLVQKVVENIPDFIQLGVRTTGMAVRFQLIPAKLATRETAEVFAEAYKPIVDFGNLAGDLAQQIKDCV